jgi:hypothetical protein
VAKPETPLLKFLREYPFGVLLGSLLILIVAAPLTERLSHSFGFLHGQAAIAPFVFLLTISAAFALWRSVRYRVATIILGSIVVLLLYLSTVFRHDTLTAVHLTAQVCFLSFVIVLVVRRVFLAPVVDGNILCGAASLYLLVGVLGGFAFSLIEICSPHSFTIAPAGLPANSPPIKPGPGWLIYYSFTTLTTVGFGDVLPSSDLARSASVFEAVVGQMLLVVMMARLVGLHVAQVSSRPDRPVVFETSEPSEKSL